MAAIGWANMPSRPGSSKWQWTDVSRTVRSALIASPIAATLNFIVSPSQRELTLLPPGICSWSLWMLAPIRRLASSLPSLCGRSTSIGWLMFERVTGAAALFK